MADGRDPVPVVEHEDRLALDELPGRLPVRGYAALPAHECAECRALRRQAAGEGRCVDGGVDGIPLLVSRRFSPRCGSRGWDRVDRRKRKAARATE